MSFKPPKLKMEHRRGDSSRHDGAPIRVGSIIRDWHLSMPGSARFPDVFCSHRTAFQTR